VAGELNRFVHNDNVGQRRVDPGGTPVLLTEPVDLAQGNGADAFRHEFDNDPDYRGGAFGDSPAKVCAPEG
jgi:hypothetical protein